MGRRRRGAENAIWRTQVFRAILERRRVLESERGSAGVTRETRKRKDVVGARLPVEPRHNRKPIFTPTGTTNKCERTPLPSLGLTVLHVVYISSVERWQIHHHGIRRLGVHHMYIVRLHGILLCTKRVRGLHGSRQRAATEAARPARIPRPALHSTQRLLGPLRPPRIPLPLPTRQRRHPRPPPRASALLPCTARHWRASRRPPEPHPF